MDLNDYLAVLRARWLSILLPTLAGLLGAVALTMATTATYQATTQVFVSVRSGVTAADLWQGSSFTQQQITSYAQTVTSSAVLAPVADDLGLSDATALATQVSASSPAETVLIDIAVTDRDPVRAADIADRVAESFSQVVGELEMPEDGTSSPVRVSVVRPAVVPQSPSSPSLRLNLAVGLLLGTAAGVGLALLRQTFDTRVRDERDVAQVTQASVLGEVTELAQPAPLALVRSDDPSSPSAEAFRRLRTNLQFARLVAGARTLLVTSALQDEGKSTTAINLALTIADTGARVVIVDADLRRPSVARYLGMEGAVGLTTVLIDRAVLDDVIQPWGTSRLDVLPAGERPPNPSELLGSGAMARLLADLAARYDVVILDSSPLLPVTDAAVLSGLADGTIVVAGCDRLHRGQLRTALTSLSSVGSTVLGIVLNRVARSTTETSYGYGEERPERRRWRLRRTSRPVRRRAAPLARVAPLRPVRPSGSSGPRAGDVSRRSVHGR